MESILNQYVSCFKNALTPNEPHPVNLLTWLNSDKHREKVLQLRAEIDPDRRTALKKNLPCVTVSGEFSTRRASGLIRHSGLMCIDIDGKDNPDIDMEDIKKAAANNINIAYCGRSVSGDGIFLIIPILCPDRHKDHFKALQIDFWSYGIKIDPACSDISRARVYSWDPDAHFNHQAEPYRRLPVYGKSPLRPLTFGSANGYGSPLQDFNAAHDCTDLLEGYGWTIVKHNGRSVRLAHPAQTIHGRAGCEVYLEKNVAYMFTTSTAFEPGRCYSPAGIFAAMECNGDKDQAREVLRSKGYGKKQKRSA